MYSIEDYMDDNKITNYRQTNNFVCLPVSLSGHSVYVRMCVLSCETVHGSATRTVKKVADFLEKERKFQCVCVCVYARACVYVCACVFKHKVYDKASK